MTFTFFVQSVKNIYGVLMHPLSFPASHTGIGMPASRFSGGAFVQPSPRKPGTDSVRFAGQDEPDAGRHGKLFNVGRRVAQGLGMGLASALSLKSLLWGGAMGALFGGIVSLIPGGLFFSPVMIPIGMAAWAGFKFILGFAAGVSVHPDALREVAQKYRGDPDNIDPAKLIEDLVIATKQHNKKK